jgi:hypothetical protein
MNPSGPEILMRERTFGGSRARGSRPAARKGHHQSLGATFSNTASSTDEHGATVVEKCIRKQLERSERLNQLYIPGVLGGPEATRSPGAYGNTGRKLPMALPR